MRSIDPEVRNEILMMTQEGHSVTEIHNVTKVSNGTIRKYQQEAGLRSDDPTDAGGKISRTIPVKHFDAEEKVEEVLPVLLADQEITVVGTETMTKYKAGMLKDTVAIEGESLVGEIKVEDILKLSNELLGVYNIVKKMKSNRFEPVQS